MALNSSGRITLAGTEIGVSIEQENGGNGTTLITLNDTPVRKLAQKTTTNSTIVMPVDFWGKSNEFNVSISTNIQELDLRPYAVTAGWNQSDTLVVTLNAGYYLWSDNVAVAGLRISGSFPNGVKLYNYGFIMGKGGDGANGVNGSPVVGSNGGPAISLGANLILQNYAGGYIGGGGGGGGGGFCGGGGGAGGANGGSAAVSYWNTTPIAGQTGFGIGNQPCGGCGGNHLMASHFSGTRTYWHAKPLPGKGGGRIFPGIGAFNDTSVSNIYQSQGGSGGSAGNAGLDTMIPTILPSSPGTLSEGAGGGGGWGAIGGANKNVGTGAILAVGGAGGRAVQLNGYTCTSVNNGSIYGAIS